MSDVNYGVWADYIESVFSHYGKRPSLLVDLGCGTGSMCIELAMRGYDMIGVDISPDMLSKASVKSRERNLDILFLNQDMSSFELFGTVDAALCLMDSLNYITDLRSLKRMLCLVYNYLNPGGIFIFDINSEYKLKSLLGSNVFYSIDDRQAYIWQNDYNPRNRVCTFELTFFSREGEHYRRFDETHIERAYRVKDLEGYLRSAGFIINGIFDGLSFKRYKKNSERIFFVCVKAAAGHT